MTKATGKGGFFVYGSRLEIAAPYLTFFCKSAPAFLLA